MALILPFPSVVPSLPLKAWGILRKTLVSTLEGVRSWILISHGMTATEAAQLRQRDTTRVD